LIFKAFFDRIKLSWSLYLKQLKANMSLKYRRVLYIIFFLIFFITAPLVILMAEGYRYNFKKRTMEKTGVLFLESKPDKAKIFLNGKEQKDTTEARIKNLLPGEYLVELKKQDYNGWQKKLTVYPNQTTFAQYVRLFKENPAVEKIWPHKIILASEPTEKSVALLYFEEEKYQLALLDLDKAEVRPILELNFKPDKISISPTEQYIAFNKKQRLFVFDTLAKKIINLEDLITGEISAWHWSKQNNSENLLMVAEQKIKRLDLALNKTSNLATENPVIDCWADKNQLFYLSREKEEIIIKKSEFLDNNDTLNIKGLPLSSNYEISGMINEYILIRETKNKILYLINSADLTEKIKVFPEVEYVAINNQDILMGNQWEFSVYNIKDKEEKIITRLSQTINQARWYPVPTHVVFATGEEIKVIETLTGEKIQTNLINNFQAKNIFINQDGDRLYFSDDKNLYQAIIQ